jgi:hypothetical protein
VHLFGKYRKLKGEEDSFTFENPLPVPATYAFLSSEYNYSPDSLQPDVVKAGGLDYEELIRDKEMNPKKLKRIRFYGFSLAQIARPINWIFRDANGESYSVEDQPLNMLSPMQFQQQVLDVSYENLIIGNSEYFLWTLEPFEVITMIFDYEDYRLENLLLEDKRKLIKTINK